MTDFNDLVKLAQNYNLSLPAAAPPSPSDRFDDDLARAFNQVPEPGTHVIAAATLSLLARRRRRKIKPPRS